MPRGRLDSTLSQLYTGAMENARDRLEAAKTALGAKVTHVLLDLWGLLCASMELFAVSFTIGCLLLLHTHFSPLDRRRWLNCQPARF